MKRKAPKGLAKKKLASKRKTAKPADDQAFERLLQTGGTVTEDLRSLRFAGVALGGGKTDKTAVAVVEYYPDRKRVFLRSLHERVSQQGEITADQILHRILTVDEPNLSTIAFDAPLQFPKCVRCEVKCPGMENCTQDEMKWMRAMYKKRAKHKRPNKMFTPYTERCAEIFISHELEEPFHPPQALGSNAAPMAARARYITNRISTPVMEVYPKLSLWRVGMALGMPKSYLRFHRHAVDSDEARQHILKTLIDKEIAFIYQQDLKTMVENDVAFDAFFAALTAYLKHKGQTEKRPPDFPKSEIWIDFPKQKIQWF